MTLIQIIVLALIQGLTEFLPVSSSAHLILGGKVFGWPDQGLAFDVATHLGTLVAVLFYFRHDLAQLARAWLAPARDGADRWNRQLGLYLMLASIPVLLVGFLAHGLVETYLRDVRVIAWTTVIFGLLLWLADVLGGRGKALQDLKLGGALLIGLAQVLALVPGTSRSGITITAGRFLGLDPEAAARFSFLLAIPVIAAAGGYGALQVVSGEAGIDWAQFVLALGFAAVAGWLCIAAFLALLRRVGLLPFVVYRLCLGGLLFWLIS
jgi:undecaprenyl-diphosphatase